VIPPEQNAEFVRAMEDALEVYQRPHNPKRPEICVDETCKSSCPKRVRPSRGAGAARAARLRVRTSRHGQRVHGGRALGRRPLDLGDRAAYGGGLRRFREGSGGPVVSGRPEADLGDGQFQHAQAGFALRGVRAGRGEALGGAVGDPLPAQARQLAERSGGRTGRLEPPGARNRKENRIDFEAAGTCMKLKRLFALVHLPSQAVEGRYYIFPIEYHLIRRCSTLLGATEEAFGGRKPLESDSHLKSGQQRSRSLRSSKRPYLISKSMKVHHAEVDKGSSWSVSSMCVQASGTCPIRGNVRKSARTPHLPANGQLALPPGSLVTIYRRLLLISGVGIDLADHPSNNFNPLQLMRY
jgi:hypothetical protein